MELKNLLVVDIHGFGEYSGSEFICIFFITSDFYNKYKDKIDNFIYTCYELDGKHSETECETELFYSANKFCLHSFFKNYDTHDYVLDSFLDYIDPALLKDDTFKNIKDLNEEVYKNIKVETTTVLTYKEEKFIL